MEKTKCPKCKSTDLHQDVYAYVDKVTGCEPYIKLRCKKCGEWIKKDDKNS